MSETVFAIVGHVNKGKSSIVSALSEDDSVRIAHQPRTTRECRRFPLQVDGVTLFTLVDTPGFEQARYVLNWLKETNPTASDRPKMIERFVKNKDNYQIFPEECTLLKPIVDGAGILYVVDGSHPYSPEYEAEMEILQWTGRPRMALINRIGKNDYSQDWRNALDQYFSLVREFNPMKAGFGERYELLNAFRELREDWRPAIDQAMKFLKYEYEGRNSFCSFRIASLLVVLLSLKIEMKVDGKQLEQDKQALEKKFLDKLRLLERKCRDEIESCFHHERLRRDEGDLGLVDEDLFSESVWNQFGLTQEQLAISSALAGAAIGGGIDVAVGGTSFFMGTAIGAVVGGLSGWFSSSQMAHFKVTGFALGGKLLVIGPVKNPQFAWIVLDRALNHFRQIRSRSHARRDDLKLDDVETEALARQLPDQTRKEFAKFFQQAGKVKQEMDLESLKEELAVLVEGVL